MKANNEILTKANTWLTDNYDSETKAIIQDMINNNPQELIECFYKNLEFGTGGLRGIMGVGSNRMNKYTVGAATQGLANYIIKQYSNLKTISAVIAFDSRNNSAYFAKITAEIFAANGFQVYLFDDIRPTPELSFAVRELKCQVGVVITASHNPKEYNGYKVYNEFGGQLVAPHDANVIDEVVKIKSIDTIKFSGNSENIIIIGKEFDDRYINTLKSLSLSPEIIKKHNNLNIVYTPIHGAGRKLVPEALKNFGFNNVNLVDEQMTADGNFPTVVSPNPEEKVAMSLALNKAKNIDAEVLIATDPDADRVGVGVKDNNGNLILLNGNQTAAILTHYILSKWSENNKFKGNEFIVKTIVTSKLISNIADKFGVESFNVLTGFKYIAEIIKNNEDKKKFICGGEESYGFLIGDSVRDKDAVISCAMIAEATAWAKENGKSLFELLVDIYIEYGFYYEKLVSIVKTGKKGAEEIENIMIKLRNNPPKEIANNKVVNIKDYKLRVEKDSLNNVEKSINLPTSDVIQLVLNDDSIITIRPSGTEPKIKIYFSIKSDIDKNIDFNQSLAEAENYINKIIKDFEILVS